MDARLPGLHRLGRIDAVDQLVWQVSFLFTCSKSWLPLFESCLIADYWATSFSERWQIQNPVICRRSRAAGNEKIYLLCRVPIDIVSHLNVGQDLHLGNKLRRGRLGTILLL